MSILTALQPFSAAGLKLSKTLMKACIRSKAHPAVAVVAALEILSAASEQTGTYMPKFLNDISHEFHAVIQAQNKTALDAADPSKQTEPTTTESTS